MISECCLSRSEGATFYMLLGVNTSLAMRYFPARSWAVDVCSCFREMADSLLRGVVFVVGSAGESA